MRVEIRNTAGETAIASAELTIRAVRDAVISGYVQLCGGPAPGRCRIARIGVCQSRRGCITSDRVAVFNARGRRVAVVRLRRARFRLRLVPGSYTLELLGDGRLAHGT